MKLVTAAFLTATLAFFSCCSHVSVPDAGVIESVDAGQIEPPPFKPFLNPLFMSIPPEAPAAPSTLECGPTKLCVPIYVFDNEVTDSTVDAAMAWLAAAKAAKASAVVFELNTVGGSIDAGFKLIRAIENSELQVTCVGEHQTMSEGFAILQACNFRYMTKRTVLLTHKPYQTRTGVMIDTVEETENRLNNMKATANAHAELCSAKLKITRAEYDAKVSGKKDWNMNWEEALKVGAVDKIVSSATAVRDALRAGQTP